ncbi:histidine utilization repressor [Alkalicaulis satelles]|uniref:Histidine utilization repressor n=1 Tax=Alkalicaulis satelles TaxID=2609175 RepID=A0A5M6ZF57_9PROT|nr:histidine utilization repressor [Alkalicaulis satelles]KAA5803359.1 histidine utilization repressor [Alkalicaulis satelles]
MNAPEPLYQQVKQYVLERISSGALAPGERAPSESELVRALGVARMTANRALNELRDEGVIIRRAGSGSFVAQPRAEGALLTLRDIAEELADEDAPHRLELLSRELISASAADAAQFNTEPGAALLHLVIRHWRGGTPLLIEDRLIDPDVAPGAQTADFAAVTTYAFLIKAAPLQDVEHVVRAVNADAALARRLHLAPGSACLEIRRRTWSDGRIASLARLTYAGERYELSGHPARPAEGEMS